MKLDKIRVDYERENRNEDVCHLCTRSLSLWQRLSLYFLICEYKKYIMFYINNILSADIYYNIALCVFYK